MVFGVCVFLLHVVPQVVVLIGAAVLEGSFTDEQAMQALGTNGFVVGLGICLATPVVLVLCGLFAWLRRGMSPMDYLGLNRVSWKVYLASFGAIMLFGVVFGIVGVLLDRPDVPETMLEIYRTAGFPPLIWLAMVVAAPVSEEILFRGFLFKGFEHSPVGGVGAVGLTSLLWAVIHVQYEPYEMMVIFSMGLVLGLFRLKTGSLYPALFMHVLNNLAATIQITWVLDAESAASALL